MREIGGHLRMWNAEKSSIHGKFVTLSKLVTRISLSYEKSHSHPYLLVKGNSGKKKRKKTAVVGTAEYFHNLH